MKKAGVFGTGMVGKAIATKLIQLGYEVKMGSRSATNATAQEWVKLNGKNASAGTFSDVAAFGEIIFNCTKGDATLDVIRSAGAEALKGKVLVDISNPLDGSKGMPPSLISNLCNDHSLAEEIQKLVPDTHVVKSLNIVNCEVMVNPKKSGGDPTMFVAGNDAGAKAVVQDILKQFGWQDILDLGDISTARGMEMILPIWLRAYMATKNPYVAFRLIR